jgi:hypothetical protein
MNWVRRNKVALTILMGLALIGLFAITQSGVAILTVARFAASFHQIAEKDLPALIVASQLSELSQTLVATAPEIALADTHMRRQATVNQVSDRATALSSTVADLSGAGADRNLVAEMQRQSEIFIANLKGLDSLVGERIDANSAVDAVMARLPEIAARVRNVADRAIIGERSDGQLPAPAISAADRARLVEWSAAGLEAVTLMLTAPVVVESSRIERMKSDLGTLLERMEAARAQLPQALQGAQAHPTDQRRIRGLRLRPFGRNAAGHRQPSRVRHRFGRELHVAEHSRVAAVSGRGRRRLPVRAPCGDPAHERPSAVHAGAGRRAACRDLGQRPGRNSRDGKGDTVLRDAHRRPRGRAPGRL